MGERIERIQAWLQSAVHNMSGTDEEAIVAALLVIVVTGLIGGVAAKKLRQPLILGYILAGVIVGVFFRAGFGNVAETAVGSLANIGVALLLFSMGLEFSKADIRPIFKIAVFGALAQVFFTFAAGTGLAWLLSRAPGVRFLPGSLSLTDAMQEASRADSGGQRCLTAILLRVGTSPVPRRGASVCCFLPR